MLVMGASLGVVAGSWLGYQLRKITERVRKHRKEIEEINTPTFVRAGMRKRAALKDEARAAAKPMPSFISLAAHEQRIPIIPVGGRGKVTVTEVVNPDRDEVIAALVDSGYKKTAAVAAVDACSLAERASGVEAWTVCALRHAHGAK